jgi:hypothetical protein
MYAIDIFDDDEIKKAKGVNKAVVKNLNFETYLSVLQNSSTLHHDMIRIQSEKHSLNYSDDKRWSNGNKTLAWGHYKIE